MTDFDTLSLDELKALQKDVAKAIVGFEARKLKEARVAVAAKAQEMGFTLAELSDGAASSKSKSVAPPKYRHPENPAMTWSGRGRQPAWYKAAVESGMTADGLLIN